MKERKERNVKSSGGQNCRSGESVDSQVRRSRRSGPEADREAVVRAASQKRMDTRGRDDLWTLAADLLFFAILAGALYGIDRWLSLGVFK